MQRMLHLKEDMRTTKHIGCGKFSVRTLQVLVKDLQKFKRNLIKLQAKYPDLVIYEESIPRLHQVRQMFGTGVIAVITSVVLFVFIVSCKSLGAKV